MLVAQSPIQRRRSAAVKVAHVTVGGNAPVVVQSMTDTDTADVKATVQQVLELAGVGSELVRITVNTQEAAAAVPEIRARLDDKGCSVPLVGDFHYNGHTLLTDYPDCAKALAKYRINPGNVGFGKKRDAQFGTMIKVAIEHDKPVRIGVNWGSLDNELLTELMDANAKCASPKPAGQITQEALVQSALRSAEYAESIGLGHDKILLSCKVSAVQDLISVYQDIASRCDYSLHLGLTEAGMGTKGIVGSSIGIGVLLQQGIGDTIRTSLTPKPKGVRTEEVIVSQTILQALGLRSFVPAVTSCPGCGRTTSSFFRELADDIQSYVRAKMPEWAQTREGVESMQLAVMGCVVNGPGESKHANIGISLPGTGESPAAPVFMDGKKIMTLRGDNIAESFKRIVDEYVEAHYPLRA